jgi:hypothetical protein
LSYWYKSYVNDKVIAWKEIVPPKEIAEWNKNTLFFYNNIIILYYEWNNNF